MERNRNQTLRLIDFLEQFVTDHKRTKIQEALQHRTRKLTVVLEDIYQPHNASAVLRSCEGFGIQDIHVIENMNDFVPNPDVELGAAKWLTIHQYRDEQETDQTSRCLEHLKEEEGYRIVATSLNPGTIPVSEVSVEQPLALCFGNEEKGLSPTAQAYADLYVTIPMYGFTQSFNISVSAALCLYDLCVRLRHERQDWALSEQEKLAVRLEWLKKCVKNGDRVAGKFEAESGDYQ